MESVINKNENQCENVDNNDKSNDQVKMAATTDQSNADTANRLKSYGRVVILLENPILPNETILNTPSMIDGLEPEVENDLRITGCKLIQISGILLRLPQVAMATGQVLFQRFYYSKSFVRQPMEITAMACVVLASKVEEAPRRIRDVINVFHNMKQNRLNEPIIPIILDENYVYLKNQVIKSERRILKELGFCVHVKHPHKFIVAVAQILKNENNIDLIQASWSYMNDSLQTNVFVRFPPEAIACACIHLSSRVLRVSLPTKPAWYELFGVDKETIESICKSILMLYTRKPLSQEELNAKVDVAKKKLDAERLKARQAQKVLDNSKLDNVNSPVLQFDSHTNSPNCAMSEPISLSKNVNEIKSVIEKLVNNDELQQKSSQNINDGGARRSSSLSPPFEDFSNKNEKILFKKSTEDEEYRSDEYRSSSYRYKNGHSNSNDHYYYETKEKRRREEKFREEKDYKPSKYSDNRKFIASTIADNDNYKRNDDYRYTRDSRSRSNSPYEDFSSRPSKYRKSDDRSHSNRHHYRVDDYERRYRDEESQLRSRYDERARSRHDYRNKSRSPNRSTSRYYKSIGKY